LGWSIFPILDTRGIDALVGKYKVTFLVATPTFLQAYMRRCSPEKFGSLQYVLVGAEKLPGAGLPRHHRDPTVRGIWMQGVLTCYALGFQIMSVVRSKKSDPRNLDRK